MEKFQGCPGSQMLDFKDKDERGMGEEAGKIESQLRQWPVQMHLISPTASYYEGADVLLAADCTAYALGYFHRHSLSRELSAEAITSILVSESDIKTKAESLVNASLNSGGKDNITIALAEV